MTFDWHSINTQLTLHWHSVVISVFKQSVDCWLILLNSYESVYTWLTIDWLLTKVAVIGFLNPKESENGFCVSSLNRSFQDLWDHGASKEPKNPLPERILWFLDAKWSERSWLDLPTCSKETQNPFSDSFGFKNQTLGFP